MPYKKEYHTLKCPKCNKEYQVLTPAYKRKMNDLKYGLYCTSCRAKVLWEEMSEEQKKTMNEKAMEASKKRYNQLSDKEKEELKKKRVKGIKKKRESMTEEEKKKDSEKRSKRMKAYISGLSDDEMKKRNKGISEGKKKAISSMDPKDRQRMKENKSKFMKDRWKSLPEEEKQRVKNILRRNNEIVIQNMSEDERQRRSEILRQRNQDFWNEAPKEVIQARLEKLALNHQIFIDNMSDEEKIKWATDRKLWYENLSNDKKIELMKKKLSSSIGMNKLHEKFEEYFYSSILSKSYYLMREDVMVSNGISHSWDYGIYDDKNNLLMVVDLDGSYFHADNEDYDGLHSKEEYDEKRSLSVPDHVKICIIQELNFKQCFERMIKDLMIDYDEYIQKIFTMCRNIPFPSPHYSDLELVMSYDKLVRMSVNDKYHKDISLNTRIGDRLITHFHPSIYQAKVGNNISPYQAWYDDELLMKCIRNRIIYQNHLNPNKILQGFNVSKMAPKVSVFSAGRAKMLIAKYLSEFNTIFDPFSGFSGRMLGCISLHKRYIGQDISETHVMESNKIIQFLKERGIDINAEVTQQDIMSSYGTYECLFTCPPYSDKEQWLDVPICTNSCDKWISICLNRFQCKKYLFVVDETIEYKDYIVEKIYNRSHFSHTFEYVILITR